MKQMLPFLFLIVILLPTAAVAQVNYNYLISDDEFYNPQKFNFNDVQDFLSKQPGTLKTYFDPISGRTAAQIIYEAGRDWNVNPQTLIVTLQKEQSLIEDPTPSAKQLDWATGYGICDACSMDDPGLQKFRGFSNQVNYAARLYRRYADNPTAYTIKVGEPKVIDGLPVVPQNKATASLYVYTPHLHGNENFRKVWDRYFTLGYPDGSIVQITGEQTIYLIQNGQKRAFKNKSVFLSHSSDKQILNIAKSDLDKYPDGPTIKFSRYALLRVPAGTVYLLVNENLRRGITTSKMLKKLGFNPEEIESIKPEDIADIPEGQPITDKSLDALGQLVQNKKTGGIALLKDGSLHSIYSPELLKVNFNRWPKKVIDVKIWNAYPVGEPILFKEGSLIKIKNEPTVYVISNSQRRPIVDEKTFSRLGYKFSNVIETNVEAVGLHLLGEPVKVN